MGEVYLDSIDKLQSQYPLNKDIKLPNKKVLHQGKKYQQIGTYEEKMSFSSRLWCAISSIFLTIFTLGQYLSFQKLGEILKESFWGTRTVKVYCLSTKVKLSVDLGSVVNNGDKDPLNKIKPEAKSEAKLDINLDIKPENKPIEAPADPLVDASPLGTLIKNLKNIIAFLDRGDSQQKNKAALYEKGLNLFLNQNCKVELETFRLKNPDSYKLSYIFSKAKYIDCPDYFNEVFQSDADLQLDTTDKFFDYEPSGSPENEYWVVFANAHLGGGCFTHGFVQEEVMVAEFPEYAAHVAGQQNPDFPGWSTIQTRVGHPSGKGKVFNKVMKGWPDPYLLKNAQRIQFIDAYGSHDLKLPKEELLLKVHPLPVIKKANLLAGAAPKLQSKDKKRQWSVLTLEDMFNTIVSLFQLASEQSTGTPMIHSGKIGCGAFNNNAHAVYLLHCLAAKHKGIKVMLHDFKEAERKAFEGSWKKVEPLLVGKTLKECVQIISNHLFTNYGV